MPNRAVEITTTMDKLHHQLQPSAKDVIMPAIKRNSLISIFKCIDANYIAIFDKDEVNIYNANNTKITVTRATIFQGWRCNQMKL
jgi:hypothetical protein